MTFINEYVSDNDVKKYDLLNVWCRSPSDDPIKQAGRSFYWTIDYERNIWLMLREIVHSYENSRSGRPEPTDGRIFILSINNEIIEIHLNNLCDESTHVFSQIPFYQVWEFKSMIRTDLTDLSNKEIILILKEALAVFGYDGISKQVPNTIVKFKF